MQIGDYSLGQRISEFSSMKEFSFWEYLLLRRTFPREKIFRAPEVSFAGAPWNLVLGTINGRIYKLSAQFMSKHCGLKDALFMECFMRLTDQFGRASVGKNGAMATWQTSFGNVILDGGSRLGQHYLNLQATSAEVIRGGAPRPDAASPTAPVSGPQRTPKVAACLSAIETQLLKRSLSDAEEDPVRELCGTLLQKAMGEERVVIRLITLEWPDSIDIVDAFRRAQDRWERDHNRFG